VDTREVSLEAPLNTPSPLREAYEAVADAVFQAAELFRCPPADRTPFEEQANALSAACRAGGERYAAAELLLQATTDAAAGYCIFQEALDTARRVNDAAGLIMLNAVPFPQATAHIRAVGSFNPAELLRAMRRQTSRAALLFRRGSDGAEKGTVETPTNAAGATRGNDEPHPDPVIPPQTLIQQTMKEPSKDAFAAYRLSRGTGKKQSELARLLTDALNRPIQQGTVSRWIAEVRDWLTAGNVLPDLSPSHDRKPTAMDPERIELGKRRDGRAQRQRGSRDSGDDD
jgi:hypothetical protein